MFNVKHYLKFQWCLYSLGKSCEQGTILTSWIKQMQDFLYLITKDVHSGM